MLDRSVATRLAREAPPALVSRCLLRFSARDTSLDARTIGGALAGTLTRAASATATDSLGVSYTCPNGVARWDVRGGLVGLRLGTADDLAWAPSQWRPQAVTLGVDLTNTGGRTITNGGVLSYAIDAGTGARLVLDSSGTNYRLTHHNGTSSVTATLAGTALASDARGRLIGWLRADGAVRLGLALGVSGELSDVTAWSSTLTLASAWPAGARWRANRLGSGGTRGDCWLRDAWVLPHDGIGLRELDWWR
jgi:hypothetical protein